jgi:hypothetical protein
MRWAHFELHGQRSKSHLRGGWSRRARFFLTCRDLFARRQRCGRRLCDRRAALYIQAAGNIDDDFTNAVLFQELDVFRAFDQLTVKKERRLQP